MSLKDLILHPYFKNIFVPVITVIITIFVKVISKNDKSLKTLKKEDLAVGLDLLVTSLILFITSMVDLTYKNFNMPDLKNLQGSNLSTLKAENLQELYKNILVLQRFQEKVIMSWWTFGFLVLCILSVSTFIRKVGWKSDDELTWMGILIPNLVGGIVLIFVIIWIDMK